MKSQFLNTSQSKIIIYIMDPRECIICIKQVVEKKEKIKIIIYYYIIIIFSVICSNIVQTTAGNC